MMKNLLITLLSVLFTLIVLEAAIRIFATPRVPLDQHLYRYNAKVGYLLNPHYDDVGTSSKVHVKINSIGLRDKDYSVAKPASTYRILAVGDSNTFGYGVNAEDTYPSKLEKLLNEQSSPCRFEVLNCGSCGYNTYQEYAFIKEVALELQPDAVILQICYNDVADTTLLNAFQIVVEAGVYSLEDLTLTERVKVLLTQNSFLFNFVKERLNIFAKKYETGLRRIGLLSERVKMIGHYGEDTINRFKIGYVGADMPKINKERENVLKYLNKAYLTLKERNIYLLVVFTPNDIQLEDGLLTAPQLIVRQFCEEKGIDFIDLIPYYKAAAYKKLFYDIGHPSVEGHEVIAKAILEKLCKKFDISVTKMDK